MGKSKTNEGSKFLQKEETFYRQGKLCIWEDTFSQPINAGIVTARQMSMTGRWINVIDKLQLNSITVISGRWKGDNERVRAMRPAYD